MKAQRVQAAIRLLLAVAVVILCPPTWLPVTQAQNSTTSVSSNMVWASASNSTALCNDFTQAGFFIRQNPSSKNWVVFLESGGLCYSTESCNRRFFVRKVGFLLVTQVFFYLATSYGCSYVHIALMTDFSIHSLVSITIGAGITPCHDYRGDRVIGMLTGQQ